MGDIIPITMPGTHKRFLSYFERELIPKKSKILDVGAGHGAFSKKLHEQGYDVSACDLFPEAFYFKEIECKKVDVTQKFPYDDDTFDAAIAIEVSEHINDHETFFRELSRILKPGAKFYITTPNILSLKSRIRFLFSGFFYSFNPLEMKNYDGLQHVSSLTLNQYDYVAVKNGFQNAEVNIDKKQTTSRWLMLLYPFLWIYSKRKGKSNIHNTFKLLLGRVLFLSFKNEGK